MEYMDENMKIGQMLQRSREYRDVTQEEMAEYIGMTKNHISKIERGICKASVRILLAYCEKLHMEPNDILCVQKSPSNIKPELYSILQTIDNDQQMLIYKMVKGLKG